MKKIFILFFLIFSFLKADYYLSNCGSGVVNVKAIINWSCSQSKYPWKSSKDGQYYILLYDVIDKDPQLVSECLNNNGYGDISFAQYWFQDSDYCSGAKDGGCRLYHIPFDWTFCSKKYHEGEIYDAKGNYWVNTNTGQKVCNPKTFNINNNCEFVCSAGNVYFNYDGQNYCVAPDVNDLSKILGDKVKDCIFVTIDGKLKLITENDKDYAGLKCGNSLYLLPYSSTDLQIGKDTNVSSPQEQNITCDDDQDIVINDDGSVECVPKQTDNNASDTNTSGSSGDTNTSGSSGDTNTSGSSGDTNTSGSGDTNTSGDTNGTGGSSDSSKDCCYYYTHQTIGDEWVQNGDEWCSDKYKCCITKDESGKCVNVSTSSSDTNTTLNLKGVEDRIDTTNNLLNDIYNLQPENNNTGNVDDLYNNTNSALSNINDFINNYKTTFENLKDTFNKAVELVKNPKSITFQSSVTSCPLTINLYKQSLSADICKFVSPYKPIIQLFFTFIFSLSVIFYFFDVFMRSKEG